MLTSKVGSKLGSIFAPTVKTPPAQLPTVPSNSIVNDPAQSSALVDATLKKLLDLPVSVSADNHVSAQTQPLDFSDSQAANSNATEVLIDSEIDSTSDNSAQLASAQSDLDLLDEVLTQTETAEPEKLITEVNSDEGSGAVKPETIKYSTSGGKESLGAISKIDSSAVEAGGNAQMVEYEPNPELSPEVEGYINRVDQNIDQAPNEIVIADASMPMPSNHQLPSQPVLVLPITVGLEKEGATQSPKFSIRWLVEWSRKIIKTFVGKVIYRQS